MSFKDSGAHPESAKPPVAPLKLGQDIDKVNTLSKSAQKKILKRKKNADKWKFKKAAKKAKLKAKKAAKKAENEIVDGASDTVSSSAPRSEEERANFVALRLKRQEARLELYRNGPRVVIDCSFESDMVEKELKSLAQQIMYCYGINKKSPKPFHMCIHNLSGETERRLKNISGFKNWHAFPDSRPYTEIFDNSELIYLSAEATEVMDDFDPSKVYIIGGIVDRNRHKGLTHRKAIADGIKTMKLPIANHLKMSATKVLTVNHVFEILMKYSQCGDWPETLAEILPMRKKFSKKK